MFFKKSIILLLTVLWSAFSYGFSPLNTDDAGTTTRGHYQAELYFYSLLGVSQDSNNAESSGEDFQGVGNARAFPFTFAYGLNHRTEINFSPTYYLQPSGNFSRVTNYTLNLKWRFFGDGESGLNFALKPTLIAPATTTQQEYGLGNARWNYGLTFVASYLSEKYEIHTNASYFREPYNNSYFVGMVPDPNRANLYSFSIAPVYKISEKIKIALDVGISTNPNEPQTSLTIYSQVALLYSLKKDLDIGIAYQRNATNFGIAFGSSGPYTARIQTGITFRF